MTALRALGATGTLPTKRYPIESEAPNLGASFYVPKAPEGGTSIPHWSHNRVGPKPTPRGRASGGGEGRSCRPPPCQL